jgi:polar amino acid transport system substrate-binding protein
MDQTTFRKGACAMNKHRMYAWAVLAGLGLILVLSGCGSQDTKTVAARPDVTPQTDARAAAPQPALRVGMAPNYPPVVFKEQDRLTGLEVDLARGLDKELGRRIELVELGWEALIPALEAGQIDVIMSGMSITEGRKLRVRFVEHYLKTGQMSITRKADRLQLGSPSLLSLTRRRVGFIAGTTGEAYVQERLPQAEHVPLSSTDEGLNALRTGTIDAFIHDAVTAWRVGEHEATDTLTASFFPLTEEYLAWAVRKTDDNLYRDLSGVLERWRRSGQLREMFRKWLSFRAG